MLWDSSLAVFLCIDKEVQGNLTIVSMCFVQLLPQALAAAIEESVEFRRGLPRDYLVYMGIVHQDKVSCGSLRNLFNSMQSTSVLFDVGADECECLCVSVCVWLHARV